MAAQLLFNTMAVWVAIQASKVPYPIPFHSCSSKTSYFRGPGLVQQIPPSASQCDGELKSIQVPGPNSSVCGVEASFPQTQTKRFLNNIRALRSPFWCPLPRGNAVPRRRALSFMTAFHHQSPAPGSCTPASGLLATDGRFQQTLPSVWLVGCSHWPV